MKLPMRIWRVLLLVLLACGFGPWTGAQEPTSKSAAEILKKPVPETLEDLRIFEKQVQGVVKKVMPAVVGVRIGPGQGSGVIISKDGYVLTAGHVSGKPGQDARVILPDGKSLRAKTLGRNGGIDSGMLKIVDEGPFPFAPMGKSAGLHNGNWCIAIGHPGGVRSNRQPPVRLGRILFASNSFLRTDCTLVNGDSGGPLFDLDGKVIGIHSRISGPITMNIHVPVDTYRQTWDKLAKGENFGGQLGVPVLVKSEGGKAVLEKKGSLSASDPKDKKMADSYSRVYTLKLVPGSAYTIDLTSKDFDAFLRLEDAAGKELDENDDGAGQTNSRMVYRPSREGEYRIIVTTFEPGQTGSYTLTVREAEISTKELATGKIDVLEAVKVPRTTFPALLGKMTQAGVNLYASAFLVDASGRPIARQEVTFLWKDGKQTQTTDDQGRVKLELNRAKIEDLFLDVPEGLKAAVDITDENGNRPPLRSGPRRRSPSSFESQEKILLVMSPTPKF